MGLGLLGWLAAGIMGLGFWAIMPDYQKRGLKALFEGNRYKENIFKRALLFSLRGVNPYYIYMLNFQILFTFYLCVDKKCN